jgi:hypothetical protein
MAFNFNGAAPIINVTNWSIGIAESPLTVPPQVAPPNIVTEAQNFRISVQFTTVGVWSGVLPGTFQCDVYAEAIGLGQEKKVGTASVALDFSGPPNTNKNYVMTVNVPAGTLAVAPGENSTTFKLITALTYQWPGGLPGPLAGFDDSFYLQLFKTT